MNLIITLIKRNVNYMSKITDVIKMYNNKKGKVYICNKTGLSLRTVGHIIECYKEDRKEAENRK